MDKLTAATIVTLGFLGILAAPTVAQELPYVVDGYDPGRDPAADLRAAVQLATEHDKRILLQVGGEWCSWCKLLDRFIHDHPTVHDLLVEHFLIVKVHFDRENENAEFLGQFPQIHGYPHIFVLEGDGTFLHSQDTAVLEEGRTYNEGALLEFLKEWIPQVR